MTEPTPTPIPDPGHAEYRALLEHCTTCTECRANPETTCPVAAQLHSAWSKARRTGAAR